MRSFDRGLLRVTVAASLVQREPKYAADDANCCPSQIRERTIHWSGRRFVITLRIRRA